MTANELAYLAFGLLLGATSGAAAAAVGRRRMGAPREIRVTVAPSPLSRPATLATYLSDVDEGPARGGPADPAELGLEVDASRRRTDGSNGDGEPPGPHGSRTPVRISAGRNVGERGGRTTPTRVALPVEGGLDPLLAEIVAADLVRGSTAWAEGRPEAQVRGKVATVATSPAAAARDPHPHPEHRTPLTPTDSAASFGASSTKDSDPPSDDSDPPGGDSDPDPCAGPRLLARERCALAERARAEAAAAAERARAARRAYDDASAKAEAAAAKADPRAVRAAKEAAQDAFRTARAAARTRAEAEAAARAWLDEINRINREAAAAGREAARLAAAVAELGPELERLSAEADAARILAESAEEACLGARQALAECEEGVVARAGLGPVPSSGPGEAAPGGPAPGDLAAAAPRPRATSGPIAGPFEDDTLALVGDEGRDAAIIRLLRGDDRVLDRIVERLAGPSPQEARRWRLLLADFVDAIISRAIEANALEFPEDDPFWGRFTPGQARDIVAALASLGYRFDGLGGFVDGRIPSQRDLSLAVGYAGLDPMRIRSWPSESELARLYERVTIAADEFLTSQAGGLTLSELVELLGQRADELSDLWNAWGRLRPLLLEIA